MTMQVDYMRIRQNLNKLKRKEERGRGKRQTPLGKESCNSLQKSGLLNVASKTAILPHLLVEFGIAADMTSLAMGYLTWNFGLELLFAVK
ncbi:hypothetical protein XENTR_v10020814 [Xenopus tropicalis]|nr:hypothetical protein XENTR_v10020814 [Xenopus tropicalis]